MRIKQDWWKDFFSGLWLELQPQFRAHEKTVEEADFIEKALEIPYRGKVLDVPCGNGRLSLELASREYQVTGVDITKDFIDSAMNESSENSISAVFIQGDMRELPWIEEFDAAFSAWGSFGYFDEKGDRNFLEGVFRTLKPGGKFMMEILVAESLLPRFQTKDWIVKEDISILQERQWNHETGRVDEEWTFIRGTARETKYSSVRIYTYKEVSDLMKDAGFTECTGYSDFEMTPYRLGGKSLFIIGKKR